MNTTPLAERLRPQNIDDLVGQGHLLGTGGALTGHIQRDHIPSMILWGPPGTGKTSIAQIIAQTTKRSFFALSAIHSGVKEVREVIDRAQKSPGLFTAKNPILFIDEIHRFSKSQQDSLLQAVEKGTVTLIGATTENPSFEVNSALLSRCQVYVLETLGVADLDALVERALTKDDWLKSQQVVIKEKKTLYRASSGDGRKLLNLLELLVQSYGQSGLELTDAYVAEQLKAMPLHYDKSGEQHYDVASALIKSIRGSDPHASVYWLARMIESGEDLKFIARRLVILAAEDIGLAQPTALVMAQTTFEAVKSIGYPESRIILSQCVLYLATSAKSNSAYQAINNAQELVRKTGDLPVPLALRNAPTKLMKELGYGKEYHYAHNNPESFARMDFMPEEIKGTQLYTPRENTKEQQIDQQLKKLWGDQ
ncbi:MAG: replication-associated recombination protein A [Flavobacteriaceae bacterium]|nr:replication-associated recombination protein A [Flavobacteriaceae bacterium]